MKRLNQEAPTGCLFFALLLAGSPVMADIEIEELEPLDFGTVAIPANDEVSELALSRTGLSIRVEGTMIVVDRGSPARYRLSGFPANTNIEVELDEATITAGGTGIPEPLRIEDYDFNDVRTNDAGEAEIQLGGVMRTTGNGGDYEDAPYEGSTTLRVHWFEPEIEDFATTSKSIEPQSRVRTSLDLKEAKALHFGTVFARAADGDQAALILDPDGSIDTEQSGQARLGSLSDLQVGVIQVSGAAPDFELRIEPTEEPVLLEFEPEPAAAPHFILEAITTAPDGTGKTDSDGNLEVRVGGTLKTQDTDSTTPYPEGVYEGEYEMTIAY